MFANANVPLDLVYSIIYLIRCSFLTLLFKVNCLVANASTFDGIFPCFLLANSAKVLKQPGVIVRGSFPKI